MYGSTAFLSDLEAPVNLKKQVSHMRTCVSTPFFLAYEGQFLLRLPDSSRASCRDGAQSGSENSSAGSNSCVERTICKTGGNQVWVGSEIIRREPSDFSKIC